MGSWGAPAQRVFRQTLSTVEVASLHTVGLLNRSVGQVSSPRVSQGSTSKSSDFHGTVIELWPRFHQLKRSGKLWSRSCPVLFLLALAQPL